MIDFFISYALPFVGIALFVLLWAYTSYALRHRFPRYYEVSIKIYDTLPLVAAALVIFFFMYYYLTIPSY